MTRGIAVALSVLLLTGCAARDNTEPEVSAGLLIDSDVAARDLPVESFVLVDAGDANSLAAAAAEAGEQWPSDALAVAQRFVGPQHGRYVNIEKVDEASEFPHATTVTIISGSYLDDSVWGVWDQLLLSRGPDGLWRIDEARRAWRCYRGHQTDSFGERWCL